MHVLQGEADGEVSSRRTLSECPALEAAAVTGTAESVRGPDSPNNASPNAGSPNAGSPDTMREWSALHNLDRADSGSEDGGLSAMEVDVHGAYTHPMEVDVHGTCTHLAATSAAAAANAATPAAAAATSTASTAAANAATAAAGVVGVGGGFVGVGEGMPVGSKTPRQVEMASGTSPRAHTGPPAELHSIPASPMDACHTSVMGVCDNSVAAQFAAVQFAAAVVASCTAGEASAGAGNVLSAGVGNALSGVASPPAATRVCAGIELDLRLDSQEDVDAYTEAAVLATARLESQEEVGASAEGVDASTEAAVLAVVAGTALRAQGEERVVGTVLPESGVEFAPENVFAQLQRAEGDGDTGLNAVASALSLGSVLSIGSHTLRLSESSLCERGSSPGVDRARSTDLEPATANAETASVDAGASVARTIVDAPASALVTVLGTVAGATAGGSAQEVGRQVSDKDVHGDGAVRSAGKDAAALAAVLVDSAQASAEAGEARLTGEASPLVGAVAGSGPAGLGSSVAQADGNSVCGSLPRALRAAAPAVTLSPQQTGRAQPATALAAVSEQTGGVQPASAAAVLQRPGGAQARPAPVRMSDSVAHAVWTVMSENSEAEGAEPAEQAAMDMDEFETMEAQGMQEDCPTPGTALSLCLF